MKKTDYTKISTLQITLLSTGSIIGAGWLFSPYYGFQIAGVGILISWVVTALITLIIGLSFAEVASLLPIVGGISRFLGVTHNRTIAFIFLALSWLSYVVYLPVEAQSAIQYLGFWWHDLVVIHKNGVELSQIGLFAALLIIIGLTWFNCLFIRSVAKANLWVSLWKLFVPIGVAIIFIIAFGKWDNFLYNYKVIPLSYENVFLAITNCGLVFAFAGFQNGLVLANSATNPKKGIPYSLFAPIVLGGIIYFCLSLVFITCLPKDRALITAVAPLLGLVAMFSLNSIFIILFIDAVIAPLGTANVFTAVTSRVLYGLAKEFLPNSVLLKLNKYSAPYVCLWISALVGMCFLLPFPTWKELVNFLSSVTVFAYLAGPISLIILRQEFPESPKNFKVKYYKSIGYLGFALCGLLIYWSGLNNLIWLSILLIVVILGYTFVNKTYSLLKTIQHSWFLILFLLTLTLISYLRYVKYIPFPLDDILVMLAGLIFCKITLLNRLATNEIKINLDRLNLEISANKNE